MHALILANIDAVEEIKKMSKQSFIEMIKELDWYKEVKEEGIDLSITIIFELAKQTPVEDIAAKYNISIENIEKIRAALMLVPA